MNELEKYFESNLLYKHELLGAFINNLVELKESLTKTVDDGNPAIFFAASHKTKTTIGFTNNQELGKQVEIIKLHLRERGDTTAIDTQTLHAFDKLCTRSIQELEEKLKEISV